MANEKTVTFEIDKDTTGAIKAAAFIAQLVREGLTFKIENDNYEIIVIITGGF